MKNTMTKIKASLTNNIGIKIIAVITAAIIWLAVVNVNDPEKTVVIYNLPVTITNENAVTDEGMVYSISSTKYVDITVSGKRSVVSNLTAEDFIATASLKELSKVNAVPIEVAAKSSKTGRKVTILKQSIQSIKVDVENVEQQEYPVEVNYVGKTAEGYIQGEYSLSKDVVKVKAPVSVLDKIDKVAVICDLDDSDSDISQKCSVVLYDKRGEEIKSKDIEISNQGKLKIYVDVLRQKEVPIYFQTIGEPANGYQISTIELSQETVKIAGSDEILDAIERIDLENGIDISGATKDVIETVDIRDSLPDEVSIYENTSIEVKVKINKLVTKEFSIKTSSVNVLNLDDNYLINFNDKKITVTLQGEESELKNISTSEITVSIDLSDCEVGEQEVLADVHFPGDAILIEDVFVGVEIEEK